MIKHRLSIAPNHTVESVVTKSVKQSAPCVLWRLPIQDSEDGSTRGQAMLLVIRGRNNGDKVIEALDRLPLNLMEDGHLISRRRRRIVGPDLSVPIFQADPGARRRYEYRGPAGLLTAVDTGHEALVGRASCIGGVV